MYSLLTWQPRIPVVHNTINGSLMALMCVNTTFRIIDFLKILWLLNIENYIYGTLINVYNLKIDWILRYGEELSAINDKFCFRNNIIFRIIIVSWVTGALHKYSLRFSLSCHSEWANYFLYHSSCSWKTRHIDSMILTPGGHAKCLVC